MGRGAQTRINPLRAANSTQMPTHGLCWTLNNYTPEQALELRGAVGQTGISYVLFGYEIGDNGTPHLQGYFQANHDHYNRFKKKFGNMHIEKQKGTYEEATNYCKKDGDFFEAGVPDTTIQGKKKGQRSDLMLVKNAIEKGESYEQITNAHFQTVARYSRFIQEQIQVNATTRELLSLQEELASSSLKPWQQALLDVVKEDPNPRTIHWIWDSQGGTGKSWMATYLGANHNALVLENAKKADLAYIYAQNPTRMVVFDLSRTQEDKLDHIYALAENLKNGRIVSSKYVSKTIYFRTPHVIFFANFSPDMTKWSADRYNVIRL